MISLAEKKKFRYIFLFSIGINLLMWILSLFCYPSWEANDDIAMQGLLYGIYGTRTAFLVHMSRFMGIALYYLSRVLPINVYIWTQIAVCYISSVLVSYILLSRFGKEGFLPVIVWGAAVFECYCNLQYSKTSAVALAAGICGLFFFSGEKRSRILQVLSGALIIIGYMIRSESAYMTGFLCIPIVFFYFVDGEYGIKDKIRRIIIPIMIVGVLLGVCILFDTYKRNSTEQERAFYQYEENRETLVDYHSGENTAVLVNQLKSKGDYQLYYEVCMVHVWMHNDPLFFTPEKMEEINRLYAEEQKPSPGEVITTTGNMYLYNLQGMPILLILTTVLVWNLLFSDRRGFVGLIFLMYLFMQAVTVYVGRYNLNRVNYIIVISCLLSILYICGIPYLKIQGKQLSLLGNITICMLLGAFSFLIIFKWYLTLRERRADDVERFYNSCQIIDSHERYIYYPSNGIASDPSISIYSVPQANEYSHSYSLGGWVSSYRILDDIIQYDIEGNPLIECIDSEDIRILMPPSDGEYNMRLLENYIETHYGIRVEETLERSNDYYAVYSLHSIE